MPTPTSEQRLAHHVGLSVPSLRCFNFDCEQLSADISTETIEHLRERILATLREDRHRRLFPAELHAEVASTAWGIELVVGRSPTESGSESGSGAGEYDPNITLNDIVGHLDDDGQMNAGFRGGVNHPVVMNNTVAMEIDDDASSDDNTTHSNTNARSVGDEESDSPRVVFQSFSGISNSPSSDGEREYSPNYEARLLLGLRDEAERDESPGFESQIEYDSE